MRADRLVSILSCVVKVCLSSLIIIVEITFRQILEINNGKTEKPKKLCFFEFLARVLNLFYAETDIVHSLFLNCEQEWVSCSYKFVLIKKLEWPEKIGKFMNEIYWQNCSMSWCKILTNKIQLFLQRTRALPIEPPQFGEMVRHVMVAFVIFDALFFAQHFAFHKSNKLYRYKIQQQSLVPNPVLSYHPSSDYFLIFQRNSHLLNGD